MDRRVIIIIAVLVALSAALYLYIDMTEPCENKYVRCTSGCIQVDSLADKIFCRAACDVNYAECLRVRESPQT